MQKAADDMRYSIPCVDKRDRMPTDEDADKNRCILAWHVLNGWIPTTPAAFAQYGTYLTHWALMPDPPEGADRLERLVTPMG